MGAFVDTNTGGAGGRGVPAPLMWLGTVFWWQLQTSNGKGAFVNDVQAPAFPGGLPGVRAHLVKLFLTQGA
ncbi:hypothetical protein [Deinococcus saxicola]|uniref:hypothetical protein n=1 Tax=Deinococcus saxicola TaxID=249406 RepID=UPI0039F00E3F